MVRSIEATDQRTRLPWSRTFQFTFASPTFLPPVQAPTKLESPPRFPTSIKSKNQGWGMGSSYVFTENISNKCNVQHGAVARACGL